MDDSLQFRSASLFICICTQSSIPCLDSIDSAEKDVLGEVSKRMYVVNSPCGHEDFEELHLQVEVQALTAAMRAA